MKKTRTGSLLLLALLSAVALSFDARAAQQSSGQTSAPQTQSPPPAKAKPKKKPEEPINPDETAGVRGNAVSLTVKVLLKGKPVEGAHVLVKNLDGSLANSCFTGDTGDCQTEVGPDKYAMEASWKDRSGTVTVQVTSSTASIVIKLGKAKKTSNMPQP
jgi:hypothetical protein